MQNKPADTPPDSTTTTQSTRQAKKSFTPRELIHYHIQNPDKPISDADIENLVLNEYVPAGEKEPVDTGSEAADKRMLSEAELKQLNDRTVTTSYDVLGK